MTTPNDASAAAAVDERLQQIRQRAAWRKQLIDPIGLRRVDHSDEDFLLDELDRRDRDNASLRAQLAAATGALEKRDADIQERWDVYWTEVRRVLKVNGVDEAHVYDAFHNATILMNNVIRKQAATPPTEA